MSAAFEVFLSVKWHFFSFKKKLHRKQTLICINNDNNNVVYGTIVVLLLRSSIVLKIKTPQLKERML